MESTRTYQLNGAQYTVARFRHIKILAHLLGINLKPIYEWQKKGYIPAKWHKPILEAAKNLNIILTAEHIVNGGIYYCDLYNPTPYDVSQGWINYDMNSNK